MLRAALASPLDGPTAFEVFSRLLQQRGAAQAAAAEEAAMARIVREGGGGAALDGGSMDVSGMIASIRGQVVHEKAESEVAIAQRDRVIHQLRAKLERMEDVIAAHGMD